MRWLNALAEGGQTWAHRVRMLRQVIKLTLLVAFTLSFTHFLYQMAKVDSIFYRSLWYHTLARLSINDSDKISVNPKYWSAIGYVSKNSEGNDQTPKRVLRATAPFYLALKKEAQVQVNASKRIFFWSLLIMTGFFQVRGMLSRRGKHVSGRRIISPRVLAWRLRVKRQASPIKIGPVPMVKGSETRHILMTGGTGSGKTNCLHHILPQIRDLDHSVILVDLTGDLTDRYFSGGDTILNPLDSRARAWHPWAEIRDASDRQSLAEAFIPQSHDDRENYWRTGARSLFSSLLEKTGGSGEISELVRWALFEPLDTLCQYVQGTRAASFIDLNSEKTAGSIRSVAAAFLECLDFLPNTDAPFSIRNWVTQEERPGWLFLTATPSQRALMIPLLSAWISISVRGLLQLKPDLNRRIWLIIDEFPSLNRIKDMETFLAEGRKYGGCGLLSLQSPAQLESIYGKSGTQFIIGNCATKIAFSEQDPDISRRISQAFGEKEVKEIHEGLSYGAHEMRDGVTLNTQDKSRQCVTSTEIQSLEPNQGFLRLPGALPITKVKLSIRK